MAYPTSSAVAYKADDKARDLQKLVPCTQTISISSSGTSSFTPTYPTLPKNVIVNAKDSTAGTLLAAGYHIANITTTTITLTHDSGAASGSGYATVFYN
ncbi:MAG TPA: hypothetical protein VMZ92_13925 [Planctomycetota bacterium]|nr:hypothetical protein [Planctomycetota bacterium]